MSALKVCPQCGSEYELDQRFCPKDGSTLRSQNTTGDLVGTIVADRYHVLKKLGEGGMGAVYLAEHVKMGRKSAVKVMNPGMASDADAISRFNREAANASRINHPNVAAVYDFGETSDGMIYLAMEYVEGPSLTSLVKELGALPPARAAEITRQASEALAIAHDMGIVHRDLKPDNIMIAKNRDGSDCVKVVDFGIAKAAEGENQKVTKTGLVVGTPEYMSPEQLAGDKLDGRSDTYSLALVAFNMFTGKLPFPGETVQESMIMRLTDKPKPLIEMRPETAWTHAVQGVMDKALARSAADRYQSAAEFGRALSKAVGSMPETVATNAFTAVISSTSLPIPHDEKTTAIPATRVSQATPIGGLPKIEPARKKKSSSALVAGIAAGVLLLGGGGAWLALKGDGNTAVPQQGEQLRQETNGVTVPAPVINLNRELESVRPLVDSDSAAVVQEALNRLARLDSVAAVADDSTFLYYRYLRARALIYANLDNPKVGCDSILQLEGKLERSATLNRAGMTLVKQCKQ